MVRVASLSVETSAGLVADGRLDDPMTEMAITAAAGPELLQSAPHKARAMESALRYLARMGGRATPYGLFAGTALTGVGRERRLELAGSDQHQVRVRVDIAALETAVAAALDEVAALHWPLRVNPLARLEGPVVRFAKPGDATADVVTVKVTAVVAKVLELLGDDVRPGQDLVHDLTRWRSELTAERVTPVLTTLVDTGLLERSAGLVAPGVEPAAAAAALLERIGMPERAAALRELVQDGCGVRPWSTSLPGRWEAAWGRAADRVPALAEVSPGKRYDLQLELAAPQAQLDQQTVNDLVAAVLRVQRVNSVGAVEADDTDPTSMGASFNLTRFRDAFRARYEDAEVPLLAAVDLESGVIQPVHRQLSRLALEAGITSGDSESGAVVCPGVLSAYKRFAWSGGPVDIGDFPAAERLTSRAVAAVLLDDFEGRFGSQLIGAVGRSPLALMARFALGRDEALRCFEAQLAADAAAAGPRLDGRDDGRDDDRDPALEPIHAELVYHPGGRIGNVLVRPRTLPDTIALTGASGGTISLDRLTIRLGRDGFQLRDRLTGRPVVVELNTAHNTDFLGLDPVYSVLGRLASGGGGGWNWGALGRLDHLPRVTCGRVLISPEQWQLSGVRLRSICASSDPGRQLRDALELGPERRWLGVGTLDHILPLDLTSARSVRAMLARTAEGDTVRLVELPQVEAPAAAGPTGRHVAEVVFPVGPALRTPPPPPRGDCFFDPRIGARWVYARLHCGQSSADVVVGQAAELAQRLQESGAVEEWHFVRYVEDGYHVRVRLQATSPDVRDRVLAEVSALGNRLRSSGLVGRVVVDDYVPEVTRYGGSRNLGVAERLFTASSAHVASFLAARPPEEVRLYQGVADMLGWVDTLFDHPEERLTFLAGCQSGLQVTFAKVGNRHGKFYRQHREPLARYLAGAAANPALRAACAALGEAVRQPESPAGILPVLGSALHMHSNRLFAFDAVRLEYLGYELAIRTVREQSARRKGPLTAPAPIPPRVPDLLEPMEQLPPDLPAPVRRTATPDQAASDATLALPGPLSTTASSTAQPGAQP
jgi:thiopeptide-type bacteriocin biosynthesis protein